jgi:hypothetical protein
MRGKDNYFLSADGQLTPAKKDQPPPDLRYFKPPKRSGELVTFGGRALWHETALPQRPHLYHASLHHLPASSLVTTRLVVAITTLGSA